MKTLDLDFLIPNLRKPVKKVDLVKIAEKYQFIYNEHADDRTSRFYGKDEFEEEAKKKQFNTLWTMRSSFDCQSSICD